MEMVERVEELGLRFLALGEELDVVDEQDVDLSVLVPERVALALADGLDELRDELLEVTYLIRVSGINRQMWCPIATRRCLAEAVPP